MVIMYHLVLDSYQFSYVFILLSINLRLKGRNLSYWSIRHLLQLYQPPIYILYNKNTFVHTNTNSIFWSEKAVKVTGAGVYY